MILYVHEDTRSVEDLSDRAPLDYVHRPSESCCLDCYFGEPCEEHGPHIMGTGASSEPVPLTDTGRRIVEAWRKRDHG